MLHADYLFRLNSAVCAPVIQMLFFFFLSLSKPLGALWFKITKTKSHISWQPENFNWYIYFRSILKSVLNRITSSDKKDKWRCTYMFYMTLNIYEWHGRQQLLRNIIKVTWKKGATGKNEMTCNIFKITEFPPGKWHSGSGWNKLHLELLHFTGGYCKTLREAPNQKIGLCLGKRLQSDTYDISSRHF